MMNPARDRRRTVTTVHSPVTAGNAPLSHVLAAWKPLAQQPPGRDVRQAIEDFLSAISADTRRAALERGNPLFRLQNIYRELGILRAEPGEKAREFATLLATSNADLHAALRDAGQPNLLNLLQSCFEFGKGAIHPKYEAMRLCLLEMWLMQPGGPSMKFAIYPNGIIFSGAGKTHEEMAREFVAEGYGAGVPAAGGQIFRTGPLAFDFDISSTAFRSNGMQPANIASALQRWLRVTGADETKPRFNYRPPAGSR